MMFLSGYTLGFFYPARTRNRTGGESRIPPDEVPAPKEDGDADPRLTVSPERKTTPASFHFLRYF